MDTYAVLKEEKVSLHGLLSFELKSILDKICRQLSIRQTLNNPWKVRLSIRQTLNNPWKVVATHNIHSSIYYKLFRAICDFNIKIGLSTSTKCDKKDKLKTLTVRFTDMTLEVLYIIYQRS